MDVSTLNTSRELVVIVEIPCWLEIIDEEVQEAVLSGKIPVPNKTVNHMDEKSIGRRMIRNLSFLMALLFVSSNLAPKSDAMTGHYKIILPWRSSGSMIHELSPTTPQIMRLSSANFWNDVDCDRVWSSTAGAVSCLPEPPRFFLQTPRDGDVFCSFAAAIIANEDKSKTCVSLLYSSDHETRTSCIDLSFIPVSWKDTDLPMILVPLEILKRHIQFSSNALGNLIKDVQKIEEDVAAADFEKMDFNDIIRKLHSCNTALIKLERRWRFEYQLSTTIREFIATYKQPLTRSQNVKFINCEFARGGNQTTTKIFINSDKDVEKVNTDGIQNDQYFKKLDSDSILQSRLNSASEYDLSVLPRRSSNLFTAVFNLIAQRDTKATIDLAPNSQSIAELSLRDSSAMKTIAVMTLVFLPATFICSFFSMTFFDWKAAPDEKMSKSLWVYFVVAIPLTILVLFCWRHLTKKKSAEAILPTSEKKVHKTA